MIEKNLADKYEAGLSSDVKEVLDLCSKVADLNTYKIYLIGGVVRDLILGNENFDVDLIVEGDAISFARKLEIDCYCEIMQIQQDLKTAKVKFLNGTIIDFASTRCEVYPKPGFLPILEEHSCSLEEDVSRRDFTINSMAIALNSYNKYSLVDYLDGFSDLKRKKIRALHERSFVEDPSRIVRGLKFALRLGFELDENTKQMQDYYLSFPMNLLMPLERVKSEIKQLFSLNRYDAFELFVEQKIYKLIMDELKSPVRATDIADAIEEFSVDKDNVWLIYFAILLVGQGNEILNRLNFSGREQKIINGATDLLFVLDKELSTNYEVYEFFHKKSDLSVIIYYAITQNKKALFYLKELKNIRLAITGSDLISIGLEPSAKYRLVFKQILAQKINFGLKSKQDEINYAKLILKSFD